MVGSWREPTGSREAWIRSERLCQGPPQSYHCRFPFGSVAVSRAPSGQRRADALVQAAPVIEEVVWPGAELHRAIGGGYERAGVLNDVSGTGHGHDVLTGVCHRGAVKVSRNGQCVGDRVVLGV